MKMTKAFVIAMSALILAATPTIASAEEIDHKTAYTTDEVTVEFLYDDDLVNIRDSETNDILFVMHDDMRKVWATTNVCVRSVPSTEVERFSILKKDEGCYQMASSDTGWSMVLLNNKKYFIWNEYLTTEGSGDILWELEENKPVSEPENEETDEWEYLGNCRISSYCTNCNSGSPRSTASGKRAEEWWTCAMNDVPLGSIVYVEGVGTFEVQDRGPKAMNGACWVDIFVCPDECDVWKHADVWIKYK